MSSKLSTNAKHGKIVMGRGPLCKLYGFSVMQITILCWRINYA